MKKITEESRISFYEGEKEIMYFDYDDSKYIWGINTNDTIIITPDNEIYSYLTNFMNHDYIFIGSSKTRNIKKDDLLIWNSDVDYNKDKRSCNSDLDCLFLSRTDGEIQVAAANNNSFYSNKEGKYSIIFNVGMDGKIAVDKVTRSRLQEDFALCVYEPLLGGRRLVKRHSL